MGVKVFAFVDHSNISIMTQRIAGRLRSFPEGVDDICVRVIPAKIFDFVKRYHMNEDKAEMETMVFYTSDNSVGVYENIGERNIITKLFRKTGWSPREKNVDTQMVADAVTLLSLKRGPYVQEKGIISLWTGDLDVLAPVIDKALSQNWEVEVWSFKDSTSKVLGEYPTVSLRLLDDEILQISERKTGWKPNFAKTPYSNSSFKLQFVRVSKELAMAKERWREIVELLTSKAKIPLQAWFRWEEAFMFVVLAVPRKGFAVYMKMILEMQEDLEKEIHEFMRKEFGLTSSCKVVIQGIWPQPQKSQPKEAQAHPQEEMTQQQEAQEHPQEEKAQQQEAQAHPQEEKAQQQEAQAHPQTLHPVILGMGPTYLLPPGIFPQGFKGPAYLLPSGIFPQGFQQQRLVRPTNFTPRFNVAHRAQRIGPVAPSTSTPRGVYPLAPRPLWLAGPAILIPPTGQQVQNRVQIVHRYPNATMNGYHFDSSGRGRGRGGPQFVWGHQQPGRRTGSWGDCNPIASQEKRK